MSSATADGPRDPRLLRIFESLSTRQWATERPTIPDGHSQAAVSVVLRARSELEVLLIKRAESRRDPWSGHMALPGGRRDPVDTDLLGTAVRETSEETGVELGSDAWRLGRLDLVSPSTKRLPKLTIVPYVFGVSDHVRATVNSHEVESVMWVDLETLGHPATRGSAVIDLPEGPREFPCFRVDGHVVWGLTYRILTGFLEVVSLR